MGMPLTSLYGRPLLLAVAAITLPIEPRPSVAANGMVASPEPFATAAGLEILKQGGNAFDAAAAVGFALAVTYPAAGNLGGGGFLVGLTADGRPVAIDFRERAPAAAGRDMFLDAQGNVRPDVGVTSYQAIGVPGTVDGLLLALERFGRSKREAVLAPAIKLARDGFPIPYSLEQDLRRHRELRRWESTRKAFALGPDSAGPKMGDALRQPELALTLADVSRLGRRGFYEGRVADLIVADMKAQGGLITHADLEGYRAKPREPLVFQHNGYELITHPLPSSGGVVLAQILGLLDVTELKKAGYHSAKAIQLVTEAQRLAYADRNHWLGDPDYASVPVSRLISKEYLDRRRQLLPKDGRAGKSDGVEHGLVESTETTHYTVADRFGNVVAVTYTLNSAYGMGAVAAGAGFLWNNNMDNFSAKPGAPNQYGMLGAAANAIEAGKRPLSSMTPTIVRKDGKFFMTMGSPGGPTIINTVLQVYLNVTVWGLDLGEAIDERRVHHQWLPDQIDYEELALSPDTRPELERMGYRLHEVGRIGQAVGIMRTPEGYLAGAVDRRGNGLAKGF
ncbi:MAG: gamma-glutamyltransferase [Gemmatimonadota bacterium]